MEDSMRSSCGFAANAEAAIIWVSWPLCRASSLLATYAVSHCAEALVPGCIPMRRLHLRFRSEGDERAIWRNAHNTASVANSAFAGALSQFLSCWSYAAINAAPRKHLMFHQDATMRSTLRSHLHLHVATCKLKTRPNLRTVSQCRLPLLKL